VDTTLSKKPSPWLHYPASGYAVLRQDRWTLRWDGSSLGYLQTAAHGHLDAQHLSVWFGGVAIVVDPGTGCYYADQRLRSWLASRAAHNGPTPETTGGPLRLGPFLWSRRHDVPFVDVSADEWTPGKILDFVRRQSGTTPPPSCVSGWPRVATMAGGLSAVFLGGTLLWREVWLHREEGRLDVEDSCPTGLSRGNPRSFSVRWQFAPNCRLDVLAERRFRVTRRGVSLEVQVSQDWSEVSPVIEKCQVPEVDPDKPLAGTVSPAFRKTVWAPYLKLVARPGDKPCVFSTTFLASSPP